MVISSEEVMPELTNLCGWHTQSCFEDCMHDDVLGLRGDLVGSTLFELTQESVFGPAPDSGSWQSKMDSQLAVATRQFQMRAGRHGHSHSHPDFRVLNLSMHRLADWPIQKGKAHNLSVVAEWLAEIAAAHVHDEFSEVRAVCNSAFVDLWNLHLETKFPNFVLNLEQRANLETIRQKALLSYEWLSKTCASCSVYRYNMRPKFHHYDEGLRRCVRTGASMSLTYSFTPEDFMGLCARMCAKVHGSNISSRGVARWLLSFCAGVEGPTDDS